MNTEKVIEEKVIELGKVSEETKGAIVGHRGYGTDQGPWRLSTQ